jgi:VCBS repeat-containing protein
MICRVGVNDTDSVTAGSSISRSNDSEYDVLADDTDVDGDDIHTNFTLKYISIGITTATFSDGSATINGTYGTLTINENGSYSYDTSSNANALALGNGVTASDIFTYGFYDNDGSTKLSETNNANNLTKSPEGTATLKITVTGQTPRTTNDTGYIAAGSTLTVADGASANDENGGGNYNDATGDHTGDVLGNDTGTSNTVTAIENSDSVTGTVGSALSGIYGDLTLNASGSYTYVANNAAMIGATTATDVFTYTVTDAGSGSTGTATITITVLGSNDAPTATDDTGYIYEDSTLEVTTDSEGAPEFGTDDDNNNESGDFSGNVMTNDEDPEGATISVTSIRHTGGTLAGSAISTNEDADTSTTRTDITASTTYANGSSVTGDYGTLTIGADGSYTYAANSANELDDGDIGTDIFTYTLSDGSLTNTATLTITVEGINDAPVAQDDYGFIAENATLDVSNSANATTDTTTTNQTLKALGTAATTGDTSPQVLKFNNDGTKLFVWGYTTQKIYQYSLGTAYDISTINTSSSDTGGVTGVKVSGTFSAVGNGGEFNSDGTKLFISLGTGVINEHSLSTAYDITTINETASDTFDTGIGGLRGTSFNSDGTKLFINRYHASDTVDVVQFTLGSAYDLSSINYDGGFSSTFTQLRGLAFSSDGTKMFISNQSDGKIYQYSLATPHSINDGVTLDGAFDTSVSALRGLTFNDDGSKFYFVNNTNRQITSYDLGENYRVWNFANTGTTGESTGDLIDTSSSTQTDSDKDGSASLTISAIRTGTESAGTGTAGAVGSSLTGTYGTLTVQSTGAYTYAANLAATEALDKDDVAIDYFTYTLSDGTATDTAQLTIKVTGVNDAPTTTNDTGYIAKGSTLAVSNGGSAVSGTSTGSNSGDVLDNDTDLDITADSSGNVTESSDDSLTVTGTVSQNGGTNTSGSSVSSNSQAASVGSAVTGLYGSLTLNSNGSYSYVANNAQTLDEGETVTDIFTFTVTDTQSATTTATLTITVIGSNTAPVAVNDIDSVNEDATVTQTSGDSLLVADDTDADSDTLTVTQIAVTGGSNSPVTGGSSYNSGGTSITGTYGTLIVGADGTYTYVADQSAADDLDLNDPATDSFTYTISDGTTTDTATLIITVTGVNDTPVAQNDVGVIVEDGTLTVANSANANVSGSYDATGEHSGDVIDTSSSSHTDSDADASASLTVSAIRTGSSEGSGTAGSIGSALTGTYGQLTIAADGSYSYVANQSAADNLDAGDIVTDSFNYTVSDGTATDTAVITITVIGVNDAPVANVDIGVVNEDATLTVSSASSGVVQNNDTDADTDDTVSSLEITTITYNGSDTAVTSGSTYNSGSPTVVTTTYGTLTIGADGTYTYVADQSATDNLDAGDQVTDVFTYTISDGNGGTDTTTLTYYSYRGE